MPVPQVSFCFRDALFCNLYYSAVEVYKIGIPEINLCMCNFYTAEDILCTIDGSCALQVQRNRKGNSDFRAVETINIELLDHM